jgi:opacity protein-like surface antigen
MIPAWLLDTFAAVMLLVAAVSAARLAAARLRQREAAEADIDAAHLLMGIAMAGTLTASLSTLPGGAWEIVFGVLTAWFAWRVSREARGRIRSVAGGHHTPHLVHSTAMLYMFAALTAGTAASGRPVMNGMADSGAVGMLRLPTLALAFALLLAGYAVRDLDRLTGPARAGHYRPAGAAARTVGASPTGILAAAVNTLAAAGGGGARPGESVAIGAPVMVAQPDRPGPRLAGWPGSGRSGAAGSGHAAVPGLVLAPRLATVCRIAMGVTMAFMLIIMI